MRKIFIIILTLFSLQSIGQKAMFHALNVPQGSIKTLITYGSYGGTNDATACSLLTTAFGNLYSYSAPAIGVVIYQTRTGNTLSSPINVPSSTRDVLSYNGIRYSYWTDGTGAIQSLVPC